MTAVVNRRPPTLEIVDEANENFVRRDIDSAFCQRIYPFLPRSAISNATQRLHYLAVRDSHAYNRIRHRYPDLKPPLLVTVRTRDAIVIYAEKLFIIVKGIISRVVAAAESCTASSRA